MCRQLGLVTDWPAWLLSFHLQERIYRVFPDSGSKNSENQNNNAVL